MTLFLKGLVVVALAWAPALGTTLKCGLKSITSDVSPLSIERLFVFCVALLVSSAFRLALFVTMWLRLEWPIARARLVPLVRKFGRPASALPVSLMMNCLLPLGALRPTMKVRLLVWWSLTSTVRKPRNSLADTLWMTLGSEASATVFRGTFEWSLQVVVRKSPCRLGPLRRQLTRLKVLVSVLPVVLPLGRVRMSPLRTLAVRKQLFVLRNLFVWVRTVLVLFTTLIQSGVELVGESGTSAAGPLL